MVLLPKPTLKNKKLRNKVNIKLKNKFSKDHFNQFSKILSDTL